MLRMEIALFLVLAFVAGIYFSAGRREEALHRTFSALLILMLVHLAFDAATIYTVNQWFQKSFAIPGKNIRAKRGTSLESSE